MSKIALFFKGLWQSKRFRWILGIVVVLLIIIFLIIRSHVKAPYQFITVTKGSITEVVSVTGNTTPVQSVALGFANSGTIAQTYASVGAYVNMGQLLAELNTGDLYAQLKQAQANADMQTAKLDSLKSGSTPQDIAVSQSALDKANQDLANMYASINDTSIDSYTKANDAVRTQLSTMFTNGDTTNPQLTFQTMNSQVSISASEARYNASVALNDWQAQLGAINSTSNNSDLDSLLQASLTHLVSSRNLLENISSILNSNYTNLDSNTLATYKANVTVGINEINLASKNLNTLSQNIASQKLVVAQAQASLTLKQAGSTGYDIAAGEANVESAQASVSSAQAKLTNSEIISPISGIVTQFDAKVGQTANPGDTLVSIISGSKFEVDADVPETDIGKIAVGNPVNMTLDAFPGGSFTGNVFYVNPAETITSGVVDYKIKISFTTPDPRMKSGLTANLDIQTNHKDNVLILPQYAILQTDAGTFVKIVSGKTTTQVPVKLGIADQTGNVEIISGVTLGEQVINIGLK